MARPNDPREIPDEVGPPQVPKYRALVSEETNIEGTPTSQASVREG